jgi:hypothetical protein
MLPTSALDRAAVRRGSAMTSGTWSVPQIRRRVRHRIVDRGGEFHVGGVVPVEPVARRCERMVRLGERRPRDPRRVLSGGLFDERHRSVGNERRRVELGAIRRLVDLPPTIRSPGGRRVGRQRHHEVLVGAAPVERPVQVVAGDPGAVIDRQLDVIEPVEVVGPLRKTSVVPFVVFELVPPLGPGIGQRGFPLGRQHRVAAHAVLEVRLADQCGAVPGLAQRSDARVGAPVERAVVHDHAVS